MWGRFPHPSCPGSVTFLVGENQRRSSALRIHNLTEVSGEIVQSERRLVSEDIDELNTNDLHGRGMGARDRRRRLQRDGPRRK